MKRPILILVVALMVGSLQATAPALGSPPTTVVGIGACAVAGDHTRTAPAGTEIVLRIPWGDRTRGLVMDFLNDVTTTVLVGGVPVANTESFWSRPPKLIGPPMFLETLWWTFWVYPTGIVLATGETLSVSPELFLSHRLANEAGRGLVGSPGTCTITGV